MGYYAKKDQNSTNYGVYDAGTNARVSTQAAAGLVNYGLSEASLGAPVAAPTPSPLVQPTPAPLQTPISPPTNIQAPQLPVPTAPAVHDAYSTSITDSAKLARSALESSYKTQLDTTNKNIADTKARMDALTAKQEGVVQDIEPLLRPFREQLETSERDRLHINENFEANQKLVSELDTLLSQGNALIQQKKEFGGVSFVRNARINQTMEDVAARAGVIQAVMAARNGQIGQAETMIDRSLEAITADRRDRLAYYQTLDNFYANAKDEQGKKLITLENTEKEFLGKQIALLESDLKTAETNANAIKVAMLDPDTAQAYGQAGVKLTDSPEQVAQKLSQFGYQQELAKQSNEMAAKGYTYLLPGQKVPEGKQVLTVTDSRGNQKQYYGSGASNLNVLNDNERALLGQFQQSPIVKDYNIVVSQKLAVDRILNNGVGGPADLALVFAFMKSLDPNSVVRETEYDTAAKSGNIFAGAYAQFNGYLKPEGGFLPENVKSQFQNLVNQKLQAQQIAYDNYAKQYKDIARRQGLNPDNVVPNFSGALDGTTVPGNSNTVVPAGTGTVWDW